MSYKDGLKGPTRKLCRLLRGLERIIKALRLEMEEEEQHKKEKQILEQNTKMGLFELQSALGKATERFEITSFAINRRETEISMLGKKLEAARKKVLKTDANNRKVLEREQMVLKQMPTCDNQTPLLREELEREKQEGVNLQQEIEKARSLLTRVQVCPRSS